MSTITLLIVVTVIVSIIGWYVPGVMERFVMNPYQVSTKRQYYRLLTSGFLHADLGHLFFNMLSLYFFGGAIEQIFNGLFGGNSRLYLIVFYLVAIIVSDLPTYLRHRNEPGYNSLGASGGVSAILFAVIMFFPLLPIYIYFIPVGIPGFIFGLLYLGYSYYESQQNRGRINHDAHFYGALFGVVCMLVVYPPVLSQFLTQISNWKPL